MDNNDPNIEKSKQELLEGDQDAKGILVAQILETKKELEDGRREAFSPETPGHRRVPIVSPRLHQIICRVLLWISS